MRKKSAAWRVAAILSALIAAEARADQTTIPRYEGEVAAQNLCAFVGGFFDHLDGIVGIKARIVPVDETVDGQQRFAGTNEGALLMYCVKDMDGLEVLVNGAARLEQGAYLVDGFYVVTSGGTHQGTTSVGLMPVDEATALAAGAKVVATPVP